MSSPIGAAFVSLLGFAALAAQLVVGAVLLHWWSGLVGFLVAQILLGFLAGKVWLLGNVGTSFPIGLVLLAVATVALFL